MSYSNYLDHQGIEIANGRVLKTSYCHKFGAVPSMAQSTYGSVWDVNNTLYPWSAFSTPNNLVVQPVNVADDGSFITIEGLDINGLLIKEDIILSSTTAKTSQNVFSRVFRGYFSDTGSNNVGDIIVKCNTVTVLKIIAGKAQTLMAVYSVPSNMTAYLIKDGATCEANADASIDMFIRYSGENAFRIGHTAEVSGSGPYVYDFPIPVKIPGGSDIDIRARTRSNKARITVAFDMILVEK